MATVIRRHKLSDLQAWLKGNQKRVEIFAPVVSALKHFRIRTTHNR